MKTSTTSTVKQNILLIDDDEAIFNIIDASSSDIFDISYEPNPTNSINKINETNPTVILLDMIMPEMSGLDVCKEIKLNPQTQNIPIIFLTNLTDLKTITSCFDEGAQDYISKPFNPDELITKIKFHIQQNNLKQKVKSKFEQLQKENNILKEKDDSINIFSDYLKDKVSSLSTENIKIKEQLKVLNEIIPSIATNDLALLKIISTILEKSENVISSIITESTDDDAYFRVLPKTIEPLKTAISGIESLIHILISIGLIDPFLIKNENLSKTSFYNVIYGLYGHITNKDFHNIIKYANFNIETSKKDIKEENFELF